MKAPALFLLTICAWVSVQADPLNRDLYLTKSAGGGGCGIEIGALTLLTINGQIQASGGSGGSGGTVLAGGGSGGGIFLHAPTIAFGPFSTTASRMESRASNGFIACASRRI